MKILLLLLFMQSHHLLSQGMSGGQENQIEKNDRRSESGVLGSLVLGRSSYAREMILGGILKGALENMHLSEKKFSEDLSSKAFDKFIERLDYGKQLLLQEDINILKKYQKKMSDQFVSGNLEIVVKADEILKKRINDIRDFVNKSLKNKINFDAKDEFETDPEKRAFTKTMSDLKEHWLRLLKYEILNKIYVYQEEENPSKKKSEKKESKDKKSEPVKKTTLEEKEKKAREAVSKTYNRFFDRLTDERRGDKLDKFYNSFTKIFDPHTHYLVPDEKEDFDIDMSGKLEGIGALLREETSHIKVERIIPGSASWKGKELKAEDIILKVAQGDEEPVSIVDMPLRDAVKLIRGAKGSTVKLTVKKPDGLIKIISIVRDVVEIEESYVKSTIIEHEKISGKYGYINIPKFYRDFSDRSGRNVTDDVKNALIELKKKKINGIILDLRNNGGGALDDARMISGLFIEKGPIVQVKDHTGKIEVLKDTDGKVYYDGPVVVLLNRFSASASEIVAAALQDYERAIIIGGEHSHGKGTVQAVIDLDGHVPPMAKSYSPFGALKITIQTFYRVNGSSTQYKGVTPDIILPDPYAYLETGERYLDYSIPWEKVRAVEYKKWNKGKLNKGKLIKESQQRVAKDKRLQTINETVKYYQKRKDQTKKAISMDLFMKDKEELKKMGEKFDLEKADSLIKVSALANFKNDADKDRFEDFKESIQKDAYMNETLYIVEAMAK